MFSIQTPLEGNKIRLEVLNESHHEGLYKAAQDERIWGYIGTKAYGEQFHPWFDKALHKPNQLSFAVRHLIDEKIIGSTRFYDIDLDHQRLAIGHTWYVPEVWGGYVNTECKLLLIQFAFEEMQINRIEFKIDARNARSHAAIKKLGATQEGVLRQHMILADGFVRDTVVLSIIKSDWSQVKKILQTRLDTFE